MSTGSGTVDFAVGEKGDDGFMNEKAHEKTDLLVLVKGIS